MDEKKAVFDDGLFLFEKILDNSFTQEYTK